MMGRCRVIGSVWLLASLLAIQNATAQWRQVRKTGHATPGSLRQWEWGTLRVTAFGAAAPNAQARRMELTRGSFRIESLGESKGSSRPVHPVILRGRACTPEGADALAFYRRSVASGVAQLGIVSGRWTCRGNDASSTRVYVGGDWVEWSDASVAEPAVKRVSASEIAVWGRTLEVESR